MEPAKRHADRFTKDTMSLKDKIQEFRKFTRLDDVRVEGRERKVPKSKMDTPVDPPRRGRAKGTKVADVDGKQSSHRTKRKAWKGIEYWLRDHGAPSYQIGSLAREIPVRESSDIDLMRAVAGITERERFCEAPQTAPQPSKKKTVKRVKITMPPREYQSGAGNKSGMSRSPGTGVKGGYEEPELDGEFDEPEDPEHAAEPEEPEAEEEHEEELPPDDEEEVEEAVKRKKACCASCAEGGECEAQEESVYTRIAHLL